jgi:hypothetical protein
MTFNDILDEALKLGEEDRSILAELLLASVGDIDDAEYNQLWGAEAMRRLEEFNRGLSGDICAEDALREVRESLLRGR